jgi:hypothetical protein
MIEIQLHQWQLPVGETLSGNITWTADREKLPKQAIASIGWRTEGRGSIDRATVQEIRFDAHQFSLSSSTTLPFQFALPFMAPISYDGSLLRIIWELQVKFDLPGLFTRDDQQVVSFRVLPRPTS